MKIYQIAAVSENNVIGKDGGLPWRLKGDLSRFKALTWGHPVIMGRKTFQSMGKYAPLKGRKNVVLTSRDALFVDGRPIVQKGAGVVEINGTELVLASSLEEAIDLCGLAPEVYVIGGESVYQEAMPLTDVLRLTHVHMDVEDGDAFYPAEIDSETWVPTYVEMHPSGTHTYVDYARRSVTGL